MAQHCVDAGALSCDAPAGSIFGRNILEQSPYTRLKLPVINFACSKAQSIRHGHWHTVVNRTGWLQCCLLSVIWSATLWVCRTFYVQQAAATLCMPAFVCVRRCSNQQLSVYGFVHVLRVQFCTRTACMVLPMCCKQRHRSESLLSDRCAGGSNPLCQCSTCLGSLEKL